MDPSKKQIKYEYRQILGFPGSASGKEPACQCRDEGLIPGSGRSPGEGTATHSSILARNTPWTEEPGGLQSMEWQRVRYDRVHTHTHTHSHTHTHTPHLPFPQRIYFLWICLFQTLHVHRVINMWPSMASFSQHVFWVYPHYSMYHYFIPFHGWIIIHCMDILVLFVHLAGDGHLVVPTFWLLQIMLLCTFTYKFLCVHFHLFCL